MSSIDPLAYDFLAPPRIAFGWGRRHEVGTFARSIGKRAFIVWGSRSLKNSGISKEIHESLRSAGIESHELATISREPLVTDVDETVRRLVDWRIQRDDLVIAIGGGAAIDLAKAIAVMAVNRESETVKDYLEGVGQGLKILAPGLPVLVMPTTAGTGSEATKNSVISSLDPPFKKSLRSDLMMPRVVLLDPELTITCPSHVTAHSGMDAITQCIESYVSRKSQPIPMALAEQGLRLAIPALAEAVESGDARPAREAMAHAALLSGLSLANSGLGMAHGVAAALGVICNVPHGLACAVMLPVSLRANLQIAPRRYAELERILGGAIGLSDMEAADAFVERITNLCNRIGIPGRLTKIGVKSEQIPALVAGSRGNSMDGNPRQFSDAELVHLLESIL